MWGNSCAWMSFDYFSHEVVLAQRNYSAVCFVTVITYFLASYKTAKPTTLFTAVHKSCVYTLISKMADESKRNGPKLKRRRSEERDKKKDHKRIHPNKRKKKEKNNKIIQPRIPKTATDISSNWKLLQVVRNH